MSNDEITLILDKNQGFNLSIPLEKDITIEKPTLTVMTVQMEDTPDIDLVIKNNISWVIEVR